MITAHFGYHVPEAGEIHINPPEGTETPGRPETTYPDGNPKSIVGSRKVPLHLVPSAFKIAAAEALADGARKYGPYNWRETGVAATVYISAAQRHIEAWMDGEDFAPDSGVHHLAHALASLGIIVDAEAVGSLIDDRPHPGAAPHMLALFEHNQLKKDKL